MTVHTHNQWGYSNGCRCADCRTAWAEYRRQRRGRAATRREFVRWHGSGGRYFVDGITHGRSGYANHSCRCEVCTAAEAEYHARWRSSRLTAASSVAGR